MEQEVESHANEQQASVQTAELIVPQSLPPQFESGIDGIENVLIAQENAQETETEIAGEEVASFVFESLSLGAEGGLTSDQLAELERFQYGVNAEGDGSFATEGESEIDFELDEEELNSLIDDEFDWQDDALAGYDGFLEELTDEAIDGIDLLTSVMHDQGQIVGLEDIQDASEIDGLIQLEIALPTANQSDQPGSIAAPYEIQNESVIDGVSLREAISDARAGGVAGDLDGETIQPVVVVEQPVVVAAEVSSVLLSGETTATADQGATLSLTRAQVEALAFVAAQRWSASGITDEQRDLLQRISYDVRDLDGNRIGVANGLGITIDLDAAGQGWFVDETPFDDAEFARALSATNLFATDAEAAAGFDLLTAIMHEQGHILGLLDNYDEQGNLMYGFIETGQRRLSEMDQADGAIAGSHHGDEYLTAAFIWTGAADSDATNGANWAGGVAPTTMDDLVFAGNGAGTVDFSGFAAGTRFNSIMITGSGYTLTGNAIELYGGLTVNNTSGTNTVELDVTLVNAQTVMNANAGSTLNISGAIHTGGLLGTTSVFGTSAITFDGAGTTTLSGVIDGKGSVTKLGDGTLRLTVANSYEGITDLRQGVIVASHGSAFSSGLVSIQAGSAVHLSGGISIANALALREGGIGFPAGTDPSELGSLRSISGSNIWSGKIDLANSNTIVGVSSGSSLNLSGVISSGLSSGGRLAKAGAGTLQLSGTEDNSFRGEVRVLQGTLE
ncbi:MAG: autotransporter-associated beta strand repeat-containing protein, partial [Verrucomicrobiales bacterium]